MCRRSGFRQSQRGFTIVTAIFILVVLAALGAAMVTLSSTQQQVSALDVQGARSYRAARAGIEWGAYQVLKVAAACPASTTLTFADTPLAGFSTVVTCFGSSHNEAGATVMRFQLSSTATYGSVGSVDYVVRVVEATIVR